MNIFRILNFTAEFRRTKERAKSIRENPEKQPKSIRFGVVSVFASLLGVAFSFLIVFGLKWLMSDNLWLIIAGAVIGLIGLAGALASVYKAIESWGFQIYINKSPMSWISLVVWILAIAAIVLIVVMLV